MPLYSRITNRLARGISAEKGVSTGCPSSVRSYVQTPCGFYQLPGQTTCDKAN